MELYSEQLSDNEKKRALALVNHLQTMVAYQQLATEIYNDAIFSASGEKVPWQTEVGMARDKFMLTPKYVARYIIPALEKKIEIFQLIEIKHQDAYVLTTEKLIQPYQEMTWSIRALLDRARFMYQGATQWVNNEILDFDATSLDEKEQTAMVRAVMSLNELIYKKIGLTYDEWLDINLGSINSVRVYIKLLPLKKDVFISRLTSALTGATLRYYND
jgi:hypothetical protein